MRFLWYFAVIAVVLVIASNTVRAENEDATAVVGESAVPQAATLVEVGAAAVVDDELNRETRQFGFYSPRPYYGRAGFYGGGFYRPPRPFYGAYYRPIPFYGGFYG